MSTNQFQSEEDLVEWLAERATRIGDDAALLSPIGSHAITADSQREGVHFQPGTPSAVIARRLLAVNLSDLAAVGARPHQALCTLAAPKAFPRRNFFEALLDDCDRYGVELIGGDLSVAPTIECTLTAIGVRLPRGQFLTRSAAQPGQALWLAGALGESRLGFLLLGLGAKISRSTTSLEVELPEALPLHLHRFARKCLHRHLEPTPKLSTAHFLATRLSPVAAIDISDGLAKDLLRLAKASAVGVSLRLDRLLAATDQQGYLALCRFLHQPSPSPLLVGGEDYALVFSANPRLTAKIEALQRSSLETRLTKIGEITRESDGVTLHDGNQQFGLNDYLEQHLGTRSGWDHLEQGESF